MTRFEFVNGPPSCPVCGRDVNSWRHLVNHIQWMMRNADSEEERINHGWSNIPLDRREVFDKADIPFTITPTVPKTESEDPEELIDGEIMRIGQEETASHEAYDAT